MQHRIRFARTDNLSTVAGDRLSYKLEDGQPFYDKSTNELYIGKDSSTLLSTKNKDIPAFKAMMYKNSNIVVSGSGAQIEDSNVSGNNTIIGFSAGSNLFKSDANALNNVVIGQGALENLKNGDSNIAIGSNSMGAITSTTKLDGNIAVGNHAMQYTKGNNNISIGTNSNKGSSGSDTSLDNTICLGTNSQCSVSNTIQLGEGTNSVSKSLQLWDKNIYQYNNGDDNFSAANFTGNIFNGTVFNGYLDGTAKIAERAEYDRDGVDITTYLKRIDFPTLLNYFVTEITDKPSGVSGAYKIKDLLIQWGVTTALSGLTRTQVNIIGYGKDSNYSIFTTVDRGSADGNGVDVAYVSKSVDSYAAFYIQKDYTQTDNRTLVYWVTIGKQKTIETTVTLEGSSTITVQLASWLTMRSDPATFDEIDSDSIIVSDAANFQATRSSTSVTSVDISKKGSMMVLDDRSFEVYLKTKTGVPVIIYVDYKHTGTGGGGGAITI